MYLRIIILYILDCYLFIHPKHRVWSKSYCCIKFACYRILILLGNRSKQVSKNSAEHEKRHYKKHYKKYSPLNENFTRLSCLNSLSYPYGHSYSYSYSYSYCYFYFYSYSYTYSYSNSYSYSFTIFLFPLFSISKSLVIPLLIRTLFFLFKIHFPFLPLCFRFSSFYLLFLLPLILFKIQFPVLSLLISLFWVPFLLLYQFSSFMLKLSPPYTQAFQK